MTTFVAVKVEHVAGSDLFLGFALFDGESAALSGGQLRITARKPVFYFPNVRLVQPIRFIDELVYFQLLVRCGYEGLYLQDSPFDSHTGNHGAFKKMFHLIYLYEIAFGLERQRYRERLNLRRTRVYA